MEIFILLLLNFICAFATSTVAKSKGLSKGSWFLFGWFFSIIPLIAIIGMENKKTQAEIKAFLKEKEKKKPSSKLTPP